MLLIGCTLLWANALAQKKPVTGTVNDSESGDPLPGVSVVLSGTSTGTITDSDGKFTIDASTGDILVFSFVGYAKTEMTVGSETNLKIALKTDISQLEEVVVVGYGEQKKSVVTGAIGSVKGSELSTMPLNRIEQSLQGRVAGLTIASSSGQPGSSATVLVRGITSLNNNNPLWIVDGVVVDAGGIGYLNQSDIESIEVLKDAASQAIYGTRAAAGVIMINTKKGKPGDFKINYNGFYGTSSPARKLDLLNAQEYATLRNEAAAAANKPLPFANAETLGAGTDWQDVIFNDAAKRQNHELSISGGNDKSTFYTSFGYLDQQGIVATEISNYNRVNLRFNSTHKVTRWLTFGNNIGYSHTKALGLGNTNSEFGGPLSSAINLDPTTPLVVTDPLVANAAPYSTNAVVRDENGNPYGISQHVGQEMSNPLAYIKTRLGNYGWADDFVGNVFAEIAPMKGLKIRSSLGGKMAFWGGENFTPPYYLNGSTTNALASFNRSSNRVFNWTVENTISYTHTVAEHNFTVLLGQGAYLDRDANGISVTNQGLPVDNFDDASMNYNVPTANRSSNGYENVAHTLASLFARVNYDFRERYLVTAILRRDGGSRFGGNNKYGSFPSFSAGWIASQESFWPSNNVVNFLKVRGGYGVVGNDNINDHAYLSTIGGGRNYTIGAGPGYVNGYSPNAPSNPDLKWEQTSQINIGFESTLLNDLSLTLDWFKKKTSGILRNPRIPRYVGAISDPAANIADMENTGLEIELGYKRRLGPVDFSFNGNVSYVVNKATHLGRGIEFLSGGQGFQASSYPITRTMVGQPVNSFYGFDMLGIFQTQEEVYAHTNSEGVIIQPNAKPGDVIWADLDDDGDIDGDDRKILGNPFPDYTFGMTVTASFKGFDLLVFGQGVSGNTIFQGLRRLDVSYANWQTEALGRWTGPGSTNEHPRLVEGDLNNNKNFTNPSDLYLEDGDYFRIKTIQIGYTLPQTAVAKIGLERVRVYLMSENLATFTKYTGYDPEIGGGVMSIDRGIYPQARSFIGGVNLAF